MRFGVAGRDLRVARSSPGGPAEDQLWIAHIRVGFGILATEGTAAAAYLLEVSGPHRNALLAIALTTAAGGVVGWRCAGWIGRQRWRETFSWAWTIVSLVAVVVCAWLDFGLESPFLLLLVIPIAYAAMLLRPWAVFACGLAAVAGLLVVAVTNQRRAIPHPNLLMLLAVIGGMIVLSVAASRYQLRNEVERSAMVDELRRLAATDLLTGCLNNHHFLARLRTEVDRARRYSHPLSLLICDIDLFKSFNDTFGHDHGDAALARVGATLRSAARSVDVVGRIGGDEFGVLMPETGLEEASAFAQRLGAGSDGPTLSIGLAALDAAKPTSDALFHAADMAMYAAKAAGRNRTVTAEEADEAAKFDMSPDGRRVAERVRQERRHRLETERVLETVLDEAPVGFAFVDTDLRVVRANRTIAGVPEATDGDHVGRPLAEVIPELWSMLEPQYRQVLHDGLPVRAVEVSPVSGESRLASLYPVRSEGRLIGIGTVVVDITDRKRLERSEETLTDAVVNVLAAAAEARDPYTAGHQRRVAAIATAAATALGYDEWTVKGIGMAARIHDIGKLAIPAEILARPGGLSEAERLLVQGHAQAGADMVASVQFPWPVAEMILQHHERLDGSGYPNGLRGDQISIGAQVIAVADVIEAMSAHRPYRAALGIEAGLAVVREGRGQLFDPHTVDTCLSLFHDGFAEKAGRTS